MSDLWRIPLERMVERFGQEGQWLYHFIRGTDLSEVNQRSANHSMMSAKNFKPGLSTSRDALGWLRVMASELSFRLQEEREEYTNMYPKTIVLRYLLHDSPGLRSHQMPFGQIANERLDEEIYARAEKLWDDSVGRVMRHPGPGKVEIRILSLSFAGIDRGSQDQQALDKFFAPKRKAEDDALKPSKSMRSAALPYKIAKDSASNSDMAQWTCSQCAHILSVPIFEDPDAPAGEPSYVRILDQAREEHQNWHLAMAFAENDLTSHGPMR